MKLPPSAPARRRPLRAFTLIEVMVATAILFMAVFAILSVVGTSLKGARVLQEPEPDPGMLAAALSLTNRLTEGLESGDFEELTPDSFEDFEWTREISEASTNGLFRVDFVVMRTRGHRGVNSTMTILLYRPDSQTGGFGRPLGR